MMPGPDRNPPPDGVNITHPPSPSDFMHVTPDFMTSVMLSPPGPKESSRFTEGEMITWLVTTSLSTLILLCLLIVLIYMLYCRKKMPAKKSGKFFVLLFVCSMSAWMAECVTTLLTSIAVYDRGLIQMDQWLLVSPKLLYNLGRMIMVFYFILKSYVVFASTSYEVSKWFVGLLCTLNVIACAFQTAPILYETASNTKQGALPYLCTGWALDFVVTVLSIWKFVQILFKVTLKNTDSDSKTQTHLSSVQLRMIHTITKTCVVSGVALLSSIVFGFFINVYPATSGQFTANSINVAALSDSVINAICMYLSYGFAQKQYESRFCCKFCDVGMQKLCTWFVTKAIEKETGKQVQNGKNGRTNHLTDSAQKLEVQSKSSGVHSVAESGSGTTLEMTQNGK